MRRPGLGAAAALLVLLVLTAGANSAGAMSTGTSLTIVATPRTIFSGDGVLIYGRLKIHAPAGKKVVLHGRASPLTPYTVVQQTTTDSVGSYQFDRANVETNQRWYVTSPGGLKSRTVRELVTSELTLGAASTDGQTHQPLTFTGHVDPADVHAGQSVLLQKLVGDTGANWKTIGHASIDSSGNFTISRGFLLPGALDLRASLHGDASNIAAVSDMLTVTIEQAQSPLFTIATSAPVIDVGQTATISGTLDRAGSTITPLPGTSITLWSKTTGSTYAPVSATTTAADGSYSFTTTPTRNETFEARTTFGPGRRRTAPLFEGIRDVVNLSANLANVDVGGTVTFDGTVTPDKAGHFLYLERLGADGAFHVLETVLVGQSSAYQLSYAVGSAGTKTFRVRIPGGPSNVGAISSPVTIIATLPPLTSLPPAS